jgi:glycine hydroxymethyltransferase
MTPSDMREIAAVFKLVLANTKPAIMQKGPEAGQPSRARFEVETAAAESARERVEALLERFPVYPEIDLDLLGSAARGWEERSRPAAAVAR